MGTDFVNTITEESPLASAKVIIFCTKKTIVPVLGRHGGLMVSALNPGVSTPGLSPGRGHCVVFLGKTLYSHSASLHLGV